MNSYSKDIARKILAHVHEEPSCSRRDIAEALDHAISEDGAELSGLADGAGSAHTHGYTQQRLLGGDGQALSAGANRSRGSQHGTSHVYFTNPAHAKVIGRCGGGALFALLFVTEVLARTLMLFGADGINAQMTGRRAACSKGGATYHFS
jgi:hypothetical protein